MKRPIAKYRRYYGTPEERFWPRVRKADGDQCWEWTGYLDRNGYGAFPINKRRVFTHRFAWALVNGPIPKGLLVCHRCDNPRCVRPDHLFAGTSSDNMRDCVAKGRHPERKKTECKRGHAFTPENTYLHRGSRHCKACQKLTPHQRRLADQVAA